jgi:hypothetical protein
VTGDLTDAKDATGSRSAQVPGEWAAYRALLNASGVLQRSDGRFWLDQRGNHDCFQRPRLGRGEQPLCRTLGHALRGLCAHPRLSLGRALRLCRARRLPAPRPGTALQLFRDPGLG